MRESLYVTEMSPPAANEAWIRLLADSVPSGTNRFKVYDFVCLERGAEFREADNRPISFPLTITVENGDRLVINDVVLAQKGGIASNDCCARKILLQV
jgi:hypothetical protein